MSQPASNSSVAQIVAAQAKTSTTGLGATGLVGVVVAVIQHAMTWQQALPLLIGGALLILFPQSTALSQDATKVAADVEAMVEAYKAGLSHGSTIVNPTKAAVPAATTPATP